MTTNTPLQQLINIIKDHAETYKGKENLRVKKAYLDIICAIDDFNLLEIEQKLFKSKYDEGYSDGQHDYGNHEIMWEGF